MDMRRTGFSCRKNYIYRCCSCGRVVYLSYIPCQRKLYLYRGLIIKAEQNKKTQALKPKWLKCFLLCRLPTRAFKFWRGSPRGQSSVFVQAKCVCLYRDGEVEFQILICRVVCSDEMAAHNPQNLIKICRDRRPRLSKQMNKSHKNIMSVVK